MNTCDNYRKNAIAVCRRKLSFSRSKRTVEIYLSCLSDVFNYFPSVAPSKITDEQFEDFLYHKLTNGISDSYQNQYINAIKAYRVLVLGRKDAKKFNRLRPKRKKHLPKPISEEQIKSGFAKIKNIKHRTYCLLMYGCGLRISEVLNLRIANFNRGVLTIKGKGDKERMIAYGDVIKDSLFQYYKSESGIHDYLFKGYSSTSVRNVVKKHFNCTPHQLRHSYATHLLDNGESLRYIQETLGHSSSRTTEVYTLVSMAHKKKAYKPESLLASS